MRLLSFPMCFLIAFVSLIVFGIGSGISAATYASDPQEWTRPCVLSVPDGKQPVITCGDDKFKPDASAEVVAAIGSHNLAVNCRGLRTRGLFGRIVIECGESN